MSQADNLAALATNVNSSGVLQPASGGTGLTSPGSNGNVLTSNGTAWVSSTPGTYSQWTTTGSDIYYNTGNVGIGTSSPGNKLEISGGSIRTINNTSGRITFNNGSTEAFLGFNGAGLTVLDSGALPLSIYTQGANYLTLGTNSAERMRIDSSGNVGIGTSSPATKLDVSGSASGAYIAQVLRNTNSGGYAQQIFQIGSSSGTANINYAPGIFFGLGPSANDTTTPIVFQTNNATERMRITSAGLVGIGATSPAAILDVGSSTTQSGANPTNIYSDLRINGASTGTGSVFNPRVVALAGSYTVANAAGVYIAPFVAQTGVTITNSYGVYIGDTGDGGAGGSVTNKYGIYQASSNNTNYFAGTLQFNNGYGSVATAYGCRAWVNFNGQTNAIRASGNVSSISDRGFGLYTVNFTNAMPDTNYSVSGIISSDVTTQAIIFIGSTNADVLTSSVRIDACNPNVGNIERQVMCIQIFR